MKKLILILGLITTLASLPACRDLDPSGVYKGDQILYNADKTITDAYDILDSFVTWERDNRAVLPKETKEAADVVRTNARPALKAAIAARATYAAHPDDSTALSALQTSLQVLNVILSQVSQNMAKKG